MFNLIVDCLVAGLPLRTELVVLCVAYLDVLWVMLTDLLFVVYTFVFVLMLGLFVILRWFGVCGAVLG